jgi:hypothetical protein
MANLTGKLLVMLGLSWLPMTAVAQELPPADQAALMAPIKRYVEGINAQYAGGASKGVAELPPGLFTPNSIVIDGSTPPYLWAGQKPAQYYATMIGATPEDRAKTVAMQARLTLRPAKFARIAQDTAYLVVPVTFHYLDAGKKHCQQALWTFTEQRIDGAWLISSNTWTITRDE